jgi:hypothetical protein
MLAIPGANVVGVQFTPTGIVLDLLPRPGCTHRPRPGPARIVTGRDGAGNCRCATGSGRWLARRPAGGGDHGLGLGGVAWAAWTNSCCERRAAAEVGARAADHDWVGGVRRWRGADGGIGRLQRPARRQGDEDRRVGQRRVALVGPRRGVERSPAAGHESGRLPAVGRPLGRNSELVLTIGLAVPLGAAQPSTASASTPANAPTTARSFAADARSLLTRTRYPSPADRPRFVRGLATPRHILRSLF